jgi:hypothetical protein
MRYVPTALWFTIAGFDVTGEQWQRLPQTIPDEP